MNEINDQIERIAMYTCKVWGLWNWKSDLVSVGWIEFLTRHSLRLVGNKMRDECLRELFGRVPHNHSVTGLKRIEKANLLHREDKGCYMRQGVKKICLA